MNIAKRIKELRIEHNFNQRELASIINVSQPTIASWENADNEPKATSIYKLALAFDVSADYLLGLED